MLLLEAVHQPVDDARVLDRPEALASLIASRAADGDFVVCLGAGSITQWAAALPGELSSRIEMSKVPPPRS